MSVTVRPATPEDEPFLRSLFESTREDLALFPLEIRAQFMDMQYLAQQRAFIGAYPGALRSIVLISGTPVGSVLVDEGESLHLVDIAIVPGHRNQGIGTMLLNNLLAQGRPVVLTVRRENPALRLYRRLGFVEYASDEMNLQMRFDPTS